MRMRAKPRILIIDDELGPRESLRMILKNEYDLLVASCGGEGLQLFSEQPVDLVITDVKMPEVSGLDVLKRVREKNRKLPVIMITGYAVDGTSEEALKLGVTDYIKKPYDIAYIHQSVKKALEETPDVR